MAGAGVWKLPILPSLAMGQDRQDAADTPTAETPAAKQRPSGDHANGRHDGGDGAANKAQGRPRRMLGTLDALTGALLLAGVWGALPARWLPVDGPATLFGLAMLLSGALLFIGHPLGRRIGLWVGGLTLVCGLLLATALMVTAGTLAGLYGPVGGGGAIILTAALFLAIPYLVVFPAAKVYFLLPDSANTASPSTTDDSLENSES